MQPTSEGESVEISDTMLFDESADVFSINITSSGRLIWDPEANNTELRVSYIWIEGRLDIGSEECPYEGETTITLTGNSHTVTNKCNFAQYLVVAELLLILVFSFICIDPDNTYNRKIPGR